MLLSRTRKRENVYRNRIYWLRLTAVLAQIYSFISTGFYACRRFYHIPSSILDESAITDRICLLAMCCNFCCVIKSSCVVYCICQSSLVGLRKQLAKMNSSLHTTHSVRSLDLCLMNTSRLQTRSHLCPNPPFIVFVSLL